MNRHQLDNLAAVVFVGSAVAVVFLFLAGALWQACILCALFGAWNAWVHDEAESHNFCRHCGKPRSRRCDCQKPTPDDV